ncbi:hypothetical protein AAMO2058_000179600 [Amorphochlora amoebiformis]
MTYMSCSKSGGIHMRCDSVNIALNVTDMSCSKSGSIHMRCDSVNSALNDLCVLFEVWRFAGSKKQVGCFPKGYLNGRFRHFLLSALALEQKKNSEKTYLNSSLQTSPSAIKTTISHPTYLKSCPNYQLSERKLSKLRKKEKENNKAVFGSEKPSDSQIKAALSLQNEPKRRGRPPKMDAYRELQGVLPEFNPDEDQGDFQDFKPGQEDMDVDTKPADMAQIEDISERPKRRRRRKRDPLAGDELDDAMNSD